MYGHRVINRFDTMSYFITRSCTHSSDLLEASEDELSVIYDEDSNRMSIFEELKEYDKMSKINSSFESQTGATTSTSSLNQH